MKKPSLLIKFLIWRRKHISDQQFIVILSIIVGITSGLGAVVVKRSVHAIQRFLTKGFNVEFGNYMYIIYPAIGILLVVVIIRYFLRKPVGDGIPNVLYAISKNSSIIRPYQMYASVITSSLTVGFGGSVGLEGPTVSTGGAIGSNIGRILNLDYRGLTLLVGAASAGAMSAIFKAPIAAIVFALEVLMLDLTMTALVPLLTASISAALVSYVFLGQDFIYSFRVQEVFELKDLPYYIVLGIITGFVSLHFTRVYFFITEKFDLLKTWWIKILTGAAVLGVLIYFLPVLYGEGYEVVSNSLHGDYTFIFNNSIFYEYRNNIVAVLLMLIAIVFFKGVATSVTFGAGGIGGIFAPTLFLGANTGLFFAEVLGYFHLGTVEPSSFALVGMAGLIAGVIHAPLTAIFLIAELTGGYELFVPLMIVSLISFTTINYFEKTSVYTRQLARRGELFTHDKDKMVISLMNVKDLLETEFLTVDINATLGDLVKVIKKSKRNVFPVVDKDGKFYGVVHLNNIREVIFQPELYDTMKVTNLMNEPMATASLEDSMEQIVDKFQKTPHYNLVVLKDGKYVGFVSRAKVFSKYRNLLKQFSED